ncbi:trypsin-like serine protease, partial [Botrimarina hoheduenensis]
QVHDIRMHYEDGQQVQARVLQTTSPINPGDSGGPIVNNNGELVGINSSGNTKARLVSYAIDIREVRAFLTAYAGEGNPTDDAPRDLLAAWPL